jgi:hypothetical protein
MLSATWLFTPRAYQNSVLYQLYDFMDYCFKQIQFIKTPELTVY